MRGVDHKQLGDASVWILCRWRDAWYVAGGAGPVMEDCELKGNKLNGLLVRDGASPQVLRCTVASNSAFGIVLQVMPELSAVIQTYII